MRVTFGDDVAECATSSGGAVNADGEEATETANDHEVESGSVEWVASESASASCVHWEACAKVTYAGAAEETAEAAIGILSVDEVASTQRTLGGSIHDSKRERTPPPRPPQPLSRGLPPRSSSNPLPPRPLPLPRPRPFIRASRSPSRISSRRARRSRSSNARVSPIRA